jgi:hypothetical protein
MPTMKKIRILKYSGINYANTLNNEGNVKHGEKIMILTFGIDYENKNSDNIIRKWHHFVTCNVVKSGITAFKNNNGYWQVHIEHVKWSDCKKRQKRIDDNSFISYGGQISPFPLIKSLYSLICEDLLFYSVRVPSDELLEEIRNYKNKKSLVLSLSQYAFQSISTKDLKDYNSLNRHYHFNYKSIKPQLFRIESESREPIQLESIKLIL